MKLINKTLVIASLGLLLAGCTSEDKEYERYLEERQRLDTQKQFHDLANKYLSPQEKELPPAEQIRLIEAKQKLLFMEHGINIVAKI